MLLKELIRSGRSFANGELRISNTRHLDRTSKCIGLNQLEVKFGKSTVILCGHVRYKVIRVPELSIGVALNEEGPMLLLQVVHCAALTGIIPLKNSYFEDSIAGTALEIHENKPEALIRLKRVELSIQLQEPSENISQFWIRVSDTPIFLEGSWENRCFA